MINLTKILNEIKLSDLVGKSHTYVVGSGYSSNSTPNSKEKVLQFITEALWHYLFDFDFLLNYLDSNQQKLYKSVFKQEVLTPLLKNIDKTLHTYFELKSDKYRTSVVWKIPRDKTRLLIDTFFRKNKKVPSDIKKAYYDYRLEYAGVKLKEEITEVAYDGNLGFHEMFQFYSKANDSQIGKLEYLIREKKFKDSWKFIQNISGIKLKGSQFESSKSVNEESPCWKGYRQIGMKTKNGKEVPNCVPINDSVNEGVWAMDRSKIPSFIKDLKKAKTANDIKKLQKKYWNIIGDDQLYDFLDKAQKDKSEFDFEVAGAIERLQLFLKESLNNGTISEAYRVVAKNKSGEVFKSGLFDKKKAMDLYYKMAKSKKYISLDIVKESVNEAKAISGGKIHKFITGKNLIYKGKKYPDIEFQLLGIDNSNQLVNLRVLYPKNIFGEEMKVPFKTIRRGGFIKTDTSKINEASIDKASQTYFKLVDVVKGLEDNQKTLFGAYKQAQKRGDNEYMVKALDSMKGNQQKLNKARKELERAEREYFSSVSSTHKNLELDYED